MIINNLKKFFFKKKNYTNQINNILNNIIEISQNTSIYKKFNISNTFSSRFEIIIIFIFLLFIRFKDEDKYKMKLQKLYDYLFDYLDFSLREIGTGDLSVGKKIKNLAKLFSFRLKIYEKSIETNFQNIKKPIKKFIYKTNVNKRNLDKFFKYINKQNKKLYLTKKNKIFVKNFFQVPM